MDFERARVMWPDRSRGPWLIDLRFAVVDERVECVGIELRSYRHDDEAWLALPRAGEGNEPVRVAMLREIPLGSLIATEKLRAAHTLRSHLRHLRRDDLAAETAAWEKGAARTRGGRPPEDLSLEQVAQVYREAAVATNAPTRAVAEAFQLSRSAAAKRVARARAAGLLPPTERGRARAGGPTS